MRPPVLLCNGEDSSFFSQDFSTRGHDSSNAVREALWLPEPATVRACEHHDTRSAGMEAELSRVSDEEAAGGELSVRLRDALPRAGPGAPDKDKGHDTRAR